MSDSKTGAETLINALVEQGVEVIFGYPGGAVLPIYDALFQQNSIRHILVRHEQAAVHAAEGYARSTGKVGCVLVTSGPGATNAVTGLTDALMDSIPIVLPDGSGSDASDRSRCLPGGRHDWHHPCLYQAQLLGQGSRRRVRRCPRGVSGGEHRASRPGCDRPAQRRSDDKTAVYKRKADVRRSSYSRWLKASYRRSKRRLKRYRNAKRPIIYAGGGVINAGPNASQLLVELTRMTGCADYQHADGPWRLSGFGQAVRRHAGHARDLRSQSCHVQL